MIPRPSTQARRIAASAPARRIAALTVALVVAATVGAPSALAQDDLYGPQAPVDVAYVRALNALEPGGLGVRVADGALEALALGAATAYVAVQPGTVRVDLGGTEVEVEAELGAFLTVVALADGALVIEDTPLRDASRGMLALYNLGGQGPLDLVTEDGTPVVEGVPHGAQEAIQIAEAEVSLRVVGEDGATVDLDRMLYERGIAHAVIVVPGPEGLVVTYAAARLDH